MIVVGGVAQTLRVELSIVDACVETVRQVNDSVGKVSAHRLLQQVWFPVRVGFRISTRAVSTAEAFNTYTHICS